MECNNNHIQKTVLNRENPVYQSKIQNTKSNHSANFMNYAKQYAILRTVTKFIISTLFLPSLVLKTIFNYTIGDVWKKHNISDRLLLLYGYIIGRSEYYTMHGTKTEGETNTEDETKTEGKTITEGEVIAEGENISTDDTITVDETETNKALQLSFKNSYIKKADSFKVDKLFTEIVRLITFHYLSRKERACGIKQYDKIVSFLMVLEKKIETMGDAIDTIKTEYGNTIAHLYAFLLQASQNYTYQKYCDRIASKLNNVRFDVKNNNNLYPLDCVRPSFMTPITAELFITRTPKNIVQKNMQDPVNQSNGGRLCVDTKTFFLYDLMFLSPLQKVDILTVQEIYKAIMSHENIDPYMITDWSYPMSILCLSADIPTSLDGGIITRWEYAFNGFLTRKDLDINHSCEGKPLPVILLESLDKILILSEKPALKDDKKLQSIYVSQISKIMSLIGYCDKFGKKANDETIQALKGFTPKSHKRNIDEYSDFDNIDSEKKRLIKKLSKDKSDMIKENDQN